jgi:hypothetical protein
VLESRVLRNILGSKREEVARMKENVWAKVELHNLYSSPNIITVRDEVMEHEIVGV